MSEAAKYPRMVRTRWVSSPLEHLAVYANDPNEPYVAVPTSLLLAASRFRECSARPSARHSARTGQVFEHDEDGPMSPMEAVCRREQGHDDRSNTDHVRAHFNGYFTWTATTPAPTANDQPKEGEHA